MNIVVRTENILLSTWAEAKKNQKYTHDSTEKGSDIVDKLGKPWKQINLKKKTSDVSGKDLS